MAAITRDYLDDPRVGRRAAWHIEADEPPETYRQDDADLARRIRAATTWVREQASIVPIPLGTPNAIDPPYPVPTTTFGWAAGDAAYAMGAFELADDEALVIRGRSPECVFWNMCLWNRLLHTYNYDYERVTINGVRGPVRVRWLVDHRRVGPAAPPIPTGSRRPATARAASGSAGSCPTRDPRTAPGRGAPGRHGMSARPAAVRIDDLAVPRYSDEVRAILDFMEEAGSQLDPRAGGSHGGGMRGNRARRLRRRRLRRASRGALPAMREEGGFNGAGIMQQHVFILGLLKNRLLIEDLLGRHPEILDEQIVAPIIICGLPRTGTTHLHNLMSADPALRSLPYWESLEPVLADARSRRPARPTLVWNAPRWRSRSSTRRCPTSTGCTR